jgi:MoaA/NifB/PqqE/SkfB family radical SAM enzyme
MLLALCAKILDEKEQRTSGFAALAGEGLDGTAARLNTVLDSTIKWLEHTTREPWHHARIPAYVACILVSELQPYSILLTASARSGPEILRALFDETASPDGKLIGGSLFGREQSAQRLLDASAFKTRSKRLRAIAVAASKSFGRTAQLKQRNLDYMRGNHKRGDLVLSNFPKLIHVELSTVCNLRCRTCSTTRPGRNRKETFIAFETLERLRPALAFISDCKLHGGGEPFLHPQIEKVLEIFREEGVRLNTVTHGNVIDDRLARLIGQTFATLTVSVDGGDKKTYEDVRLRGKWDKLLRGLDKLNRHRGPDFKLIIGVVLLRCNIHQLADLVRFTHEHGGQELQAAWLVPFHDLPWTNEQGLTDDPERTNAYMAEARAVGRELGVSVRIPNDLPTERTGSIVRLTHKDTYHGLHGTTQVEGHCRLMYDRAMILVDGRVKPCGQSRTVPELGSIHHRSFESCWNGTGYQRLRRTFNEGTLPRTCMSCNFIRSNQTGTARLVYARQDA